MKCKICGHRTNTIGAMASHYRKDHPRSLRKRSLGSFHAQRGSSDRSRKDVEAMFCPHCGYKLS